MSLNVATRTKAPTFGSSSALYSVVQGPYLVCSLGVLEMVGRVRIIVACHTCKWLQYGAATAVVFDIRIVI